MLKRLVIAAVGLLSSTTTLASPPNIVLILANDLCISDVGVYGGAVTKTPRIDQLADDGIRALQAYISHNAPISSLDLMAAFAHAAGLQISVSAKTALISYPNCETRKQVIPTIFFTGGRVQRGRSEASAGSSFNTRRPISARRI